VITVSEFVTGAIWFAILCVASLALEQWRKFLRDGLRATGGSEHSYKWRKVGRRRTRIGVYITWIWVLLFSAVSLLTATLPTEANGWGDWAAGLAAPLAFGWLVLGYLQQSQQLDSNAKSLSDSVEKQNKILEAAQRQAAAAEAANRPWLKIAGMKPVRVNFHQTGVTIETQISYKNLGNSPAHSVRTWMTAEPFLVGQNKVPSGALASADAIPPELLELMKASGEILFPEEEASVIQGTNVPNDFQKDSPGVLLTGFYVAVLLEYRFGNGASGKTHVIYLLQRRDRVSGKPAPIIPGQSIVDAGDLLMMAWPSDRLIS
jgi:hypothetical protein